MNLKIKQLRTDGVVTTRTVTTPACLDYETADRKGAVRADIQRLLREQPPVRRYADPTTRRKILDIFPLAGVGAGQVAVVQVGQYRFLLNVDGQRWLTLQARDLKAAERYARRCEREMTWLGDVEQRDRAVANLARRVVRA